MGGNTHSFTSDWRTSADRDQIEKATHTPLPPESTGALVALTWPWSAIHPEEAVMGKIHKVYSTKRQAATGPRLATNKLPSVNRGQATLWDDHRLPSTSHKPSTPPHLQVRGDRIDWCRQTELRGGQRLPQGDGDNCSDWVKNPRGWLIKSLEHVHTHTQCSQATLRPNCILLAENASRS